MKTFLIMYFGTRNPTSDTAKRLEALGFETNYGPYDFVYDWGGKNPTKEEILALGDRIVETLKDTNVMFNLDTHD